MKYSILFLLFIFLLACSSSPVGKSSNEDSLYNTTIKYEESKGDEDLDESIVFNLMIDSIYNEIVKRNFDTLEANAKKKYSEFDHHRLIEILIAKKSVKKSDLERIQNIYSCKCKHISVKKKDSEDLVIDEYICKSSEDASFWFNLIYDCYLCNNNSLSEPLKEPYKLWQSNNRIIHLYTRAEMWRSDMESINKALMKCFVFSGTKCE